MINSAKHFFKYLKKSYSKSIQSNLERSNKEKSRKRNDINPLNCFRQADLTYQIESRDKYQIEKKTTATNTNKQNSRFSIKFKYNKVKS